MTGSLQKRGKFWYLRVDMGKDPQTGKRIQKSINTKCEKKPDAEKVKVRILVELDNGLFIGTDNITFLGFMEDWLENQVKRNCEQTTYQNYKVVFDAYIKPYFKKSNIKLQDLQPMHLQKYYDYLLKNGRKNNQNTKGTGLSPNSIHRQHANIRKCLDYALKMQMVSRNVALAVVLPKKEKFQGKAYSETELKSLIEVSNGDPIQLPIVLASGLGLRRGEVCGLKWKHVDLDNGIVSIEETRTRQSKDEIEKGTKNDSSVRELPIPAYVKAFLKNVKKQQTENRLLCGDGYIKSDYVCTMPDGSPLKVNYVSHRFKAMILKGGLREIRFHDLRHTNATLLLKKNINIKWISDWLGHSEISTTMNVYSHVTTEMKKEVANELDKILAM